jgi:hypothetical protein
VWDAVMVVTRPDGYADGHIRRRSADTPQNGKCHAGRKQRLFHAGLQG